MFNFILLFYYAWHYFEKLNFITILWYNITKLFLRGLAQVFNFEKIFAKIACPYVNSMVVNVSASCSLVERTQTVNFVIQKIIKTLKENNKV